MRTGLVVALACALAAAGCERVSSEKIEQWKSTQKGPGKLLDALKDSTVAPGLRAEAAAALVDIGQADDVDQAMVGIPAGERWEILKTLIPIHTREIKNPALPKARAARDALFSVRQYAPPEEQKQIDAVMLPALEKDLREGRLSGGRHSMEKIFGAIGPSAGPLVVGLIEDPRVPFVGLADILVRVGDDNARERAGEALVKRARAQPDVSPALWRAIGTVGGKAATAFLTEKIERGHEKDAVAAAMALQQRREPGMLQLALKIAGDAGANKAVRDEMFGVVEKIGGPEATRGLIAIIGTDPVDMVRYRAYEGAVAIGGADAAVQALEAFPASATFKREDVVDLLVKDILKLGDAGKPAMLKALRSPAPLARMTGVLAAESKLPSNPNKTLGDASDAPALLKLSGDKGTVKGFPAGATVGKEAARVAAILQKAGA
jgi:hypothetical protein